MTWKPAKREGSYADLVIQAVIQNATGKRASASTAAREIASGLWGRAFESAEMTPEGIISDALRPHLALIGRMLIITGEVAFGIDVEGGALLLTPAKSLSVMGDPDPRTWVYELTMAGPSTTTTRTLPADRVLHLTYATETDHPWRGVGPLTGAASTVDLLSELESKLGQESASPTGNLIPVPQGVDIRNLQTDLRELKGNLALVPTTASGFGAGFTAAPRGDYDVKRIGPNPPIAAVELRQGASQSILAACGVPVGMVGGDGGSATEMRESYRQFLHGSVDPIARRVARQVKAAFDTDFGFSFDRLFASDLSGRARAFQSMVGGGMEVEKAAALAQLMTPE